jgi:hypothetical protein
MMHSDAQCLKSFPLDHDWQATSGRRITVTIPPQDYEEVLRMAKEKKVSASWIVL